MADQGGDEGPPKFMAMNFGRNGRVHREVDERDRINAETAEDAIQVIIDERVCLLFASELNNASPNYGCFNTANALGTRLGGEAGWRRVGQEDHGTTAMFWDEYFLVEVRVDEEYWQYPGIISNDNKRHVHKVLQRPGDYASRFIAVGYHGPTGHDNQYKTRRIIALVKAFMAISQGDGMDYPPVLFGGDWNLDARKVDDCFREALKETDYKYSPYYQRTGGADSEQAKDTTAGKQAIDHIWVIWHSSRPADFLQLKNPEVHYSQRVDDFTGREHYMLWRDGRNLNHYPVTVEAHGLLAGAMPAAGQNIDLSAMEERLERIEGMLGNLPQLLVSALQDQGMMLHAGGGRVRGSGSGDGPEVSPEGDPLSARESSPATTIGVHEPEVPEPEVPEPEVPEPEVPEPEVPEPEVPEPEVPGTEVPEPEVPGTEVPGTEVHEPDVPETEVPGTEVPEPDVPVVQPEGGGGGGGDGGGGGGW